jgi:hypothetical protein
MSHFICPAPGENADPRNPRHKAKTESFLMQNPLKTMDGTQIPETCESTIFGFALLCKSA